MSASSLKNFHPVIQNWFLGKFSAPSPPQANGWPQIAAGNNTLILAPTGSGKTLAAFLWCLNDILQGGSSGIHTLYISPLKALNNDIHRNLQEPLAGIQDHAKALGLTIAGIRALVRTGDTPSHVRQAIVKHPPEILITTPESLYLLVTSERGRQIFSGLRYLIVDEIHALCNSKRGVHMSLTLERLMPLCRQEPVRIGLSATQRPLERIAAFLGGQVFKTSERPVPRPVEIVDCGQRKDLDLKVISPVQSFSDLPDSSVWPAVIDQLYELITTHRTTLVFANMRAQTERIARLLNEKHQRNTGTDGVVLALAHHGSISRETRYDIETRLKAGEIPCVIATASLELGIDIGSIDLVVQLEAPRSISSALQRVGRSGHVLTATSKGRIIPMYPSDLDDAVAMVAFMAKGEIEETRIPENCLDVLAQQLVAELALQDWSREDLYRLTRQSYCYRNLSSEAFNEVLEMLAGRFADAPLRALQPRISWDRVNEQLFGLKGARLLATMNGGTIPDRGYFAVYLADSNVRLGEMEEEFVFESRIGNVFFLGNNEWRIEDIKQDRIMVTPVKSVKPRAPFWKGDVVYRQLEASEKIGAFRRSMLDNLEEDFSASNFLCDEHTLANLRTYLKKQHEATGRIPTDKTVVAEWFRDSVDEPHLILHTCFGAGVNALLAMAIASRVENQFGAQVQFTYDDDGLLLRIMDTTEPFELEQLLLLSPDEVENLLLAKLIDTPVFTVRFRYNAARALILSRSQPGNRIPLWLQRLRAADLLQVVRQYRDFPILVETYRDCLEEIFDLAGLKKVLAKLQQKEVAIHTVHTLVPSPMAAGLLFDFTAENLYEMDRSRLPGQIAAVSSELLADILSQESIPAIVTQELICEAEERWQHLTPLSQAREQEVLFEVLRQMAPITTAELRKRAREAIENWLETLVMAGRIIETPAGWIATDDEAMFATPEKPASQQERIRRLLHLRGPTAVDEICTTLDFSETDVRAALDLLLREKEIVRGILIAGNENEVWCDRHNFAELYRRAIARRREISKPADKADLFQFLLGWHKISVNESVENVLQQYIGFRMPLQGIEREILRTRAAANASDLPAAREQFQHFVSKGDFILRAHRTGEESRVLMDIIPRRAGHLFENQAALKEKAETLADNAVTVFRFLKENGASFLRDIADGTDLSAMQVKSALGEIAKSGLVSSDNPAMFKSGLQSESTRPKTAKSDWLPRSHFPGRGRRPSRRALRETVREQVKYGDSRWFLTTSYAVAGKAITETERAERQARLLLQRYGILAKEWYRREQGFLPWFRLFQALRKMEWQGEIRRGYFVEGLSGVQFALPEAIDLLERIRSRQVAIPSQPILLSTHDPALPFGPGFEWGFENKHGDKLTIVRMLANHVLFLRGVPVFYSENYASRIHRLAKIPDPRLDDCVSAFKTLLQLPADIRPRKKLEIQKINNQPATECQLSEVFLRNGFERSGKTLILWPSAVYGDGK